MHKFFSLCLLGAVSIGLLAAASNIPVQAATPVPTPGAPSQSPDIPPGVNPLTGLPAVEPELLKIPAVLVSVSNFPGATRPQIGLSYASQIYEFWIGVGMTRFLPIFYGNFPAIRPAMIGDCPVRWGVYEGAEPIVGRRVWFDENRDGVMDLNERGVPGVCVDLLDAGSGETLAATVSDSNGNFGFSPPPGKEIKLRFHAPLGTSFTAVGRGSIADSASGLSEAISISQNDFSRNAGLVWTDETPPTPVVGKGDARVSNVIWLDADRDNVIDDDEERLAGVQVDLYDGVSDELLAVTRSAADGRYTFQVEAGHEYDLRLLPDLGASYVVSAEHMREDYAVNDYEDPISGFSPIFTAESFAEAPWTLGMKVAQVGPVRSGRIIFQYIAGFFNRARLFYASKSENVFIGGAGNVYGEDPRSISSAYIEVARMIESARTAEGNEEPRYVSNIYNQEPPPGGKDARTVTYFVNVLNTSQFRYDLLSGEYLRLDDHSDGRGSLYPSVDRLNGRQIHVSNIIVVFAEHTQIEGLKIDMSITPNQQNPAMIFRDGKAYAGIWSTLNEEFEKTTQKLRPPRIFDDKGRLFPLKPGQTWFIMVTPRTTLTEDDPGVWRIRFFEPSLVGNFLKFTTP